MGNNLILACKKEAQEWARNKLISEAEENNNVAEVERLKNYKFEVENE